MSQPDKALKNDLDPVLAAAGRMERRDAAQDERGRAVAAMRQLGHVPDGCGPEIPDAPARGPVVRFMPRTMYPDGEEGFVAKDAGYQGRQTIRHADAFDVMISRAASKGKPSPFTPAQISMGRFYRDLNEKHQSAGLRCSSMEAMSGGSSGGGGEYMDAVLRDRERLDVMRTRIGSGVAMVVRRQRPSARGSRVNILDMRLVHAVCVEEKEMTQILKEHGWTNRGGSIAALTQALREALDRMEGPVRNARGGSVVYGEPVSCPFA